MLSEVSGSTIDISFGPGGPSPRILLIITEQGDGRDASGEKYRSGTGKDAGRYGAFTPYSGSQSALGFASHRAHTILAYPVPNAGSLSPFRSAPSGAKTGDAAPAFTGAPAFATLALFSPATSATVAFALGAAFFATEAYLSMYVLAFDPVFPAAGPTESTAPPVFGSRSLRSGLLRSSSRSRRAGSHSSGTSTTGFGTTDASGGAAGYTGARTRYRSGTREKAGTPFNPYNIL